MSRFSDYIQYYCSMNKDNAYDNELDKLAYNIAILGRKGYTADSDNVQIAVEKFNRHFKRIKIFDNGNC